MFQRVAKCLLPFIGALFLTALLSSAVFAQRPTPGPGPTSGRTSNNSSPLEGGDPTIDIDVYVRGADGAPIDVTAVVSLIAPMGQVLSQGTTLGGNIQFKGIAASQYTIQVVAAGYENTVKEFDGYNAGASRVIIDMRPSSDGNAGAGSPQMLLAPKAQKELAKAVEALRANKPGDARSHLEAAYRMAPNHPAVNYLYGVYFLQMKDQEKAKSYWAKALEFNPKHVSALLSMSEALLREQKIPDAESYIKKAVEADPNSWRAHAILADVFLKEGQPGEAAKEADRAVELGKGQAAMVQPFLARALMESGNKERAERVLKDYIQDHPNDAGARKQLDSLLSPMPVPSPNAGTVTAEAKLAPAAATEAGISLPLPSNWLPPDVDEKVPSVQPGFACALDDVVQKAGKRVEEFVKNVDRFTATEFLNHESINKWGIAESPEKRKFDYLVSIEQYRPGYFGVVEYRGNRYSRNQFPGGIETHGLPALSLIFHPANAGNFAMTCEGLAMWNGRPAWQVHFRQRPDKPNTIRAYKFGENGPSHAVALRGRAWIVADSYQIVRMETDLVAKLPEIKLLADHTIVDYGPVRFKNRNVEMWLPQNAEVYFDWQGKRVHRRHLFTDYMLFSVDEKQKIAEPKQETQGPVEN
jgi:tetratricopeptide (TPR) repeat protein